MFKSIRTAVTAAVAAVALSGIASNALADDTQWQKDHPRREQVNNRLANQNQRIKQERKEGEITKAQAQRARGGSAAHCAPAFFCAPTRLLRAQRSQARSEKGVKSVSRS